MYSLRKECGSYIVDRHNLLKVNCNVDITIEPLPSTVFERPCAEKAVCEGSLTGRRIPVCIPPVSFRIFDRLADSEVPHRMSRLITVTIFIGKVKCAISHVLESVQQH
jgi:hypothetical protein